MRSFKSSSAYINIYLDKYPPWKTSNDASGKDKQNPRSQIQFGLVKIDWPPTTNISFGPHGTIF